MVDFTGVEGSDANCNFDRRHPSSAAFPQFTNSDDGRRVLESIDEKYVKLIWRGLINFN